MSEESDPESGSVRALDPSGTAAESQADVTGPAPDQRRGRIVRILVGIGLWVFGVIAALLLVLLVGANFPQISYLGPIGSFLSVPLSVWFFTLPLVALVFAILALRGGLRRSGLVLGLVALLAIVGAGVVNVRLVAVAIGNGVSVNPFAAYSLTVYNTGTPDLTEVYTTHGGQQLKADVYEPPAHTAPAPIIFYIHGGGWVANNRALTSGNLRWYAQQGWVVVSIDYTLATATSPTWNLAQSQVACGMSWTMRNAARFGGNVGQFTVMGDSAGGNLGINTAYAANAGTAASSCGGALPHVDAVATIYPAVDPAEMARSTDPLLGAATRAMGLDYTGGSPSEESARYAAVSSVDYINKQAPPTLIQLGENDHLVSPQSTYDFAQRATAAGVDVKLVKYPYADHVYDGLFDDIASQSVRQIATQFLGRHGQAPAH